MTFFSKLFGNRKNNVQPEVISDRPIVKEELFVNAQEPVTPEQKTAEPEYKRALDRILDREFELMGYRDAVNYANDDIVEMFENRLITEASNVLEDEISRIQAQLAQMQTMVKEDGQVLVQQKLNTKIALLKKKEGDLYLKVMDIRDKKGLIAPAIFDYQLGFQRGYEDYINQIQG